MPGAHRLGGDLAEHDDGQGGEDDGYEAGGEVVQEDGEDGVDEDVAQKDGAEEVVAVRPHRLDGLGELALPGGACGERNSLDRFSTFCVRQ